MLMVALGVGGMAKLGRFHLGIAAVTVFLALFLGITYYRRAEHEAFKSGRSSATRAARVTSGVSASHRSRTRAWLNEVVRHRALLFYALAVWGGYELALLVGMRGEPAVIFAWLLFPALLVVLGYLCKRFPRFETRIRPASQWLFGKE